MLKTLPHPRELCYGTRVLVCSGVKRLLPGRWNTPIRQLKKSGCERIATSCTHKRLRQRRDPRKQAKPARASIARQGQRHASCRNAAAPQRRKTATQAKRATQAKQPGVQASSTRICAFSLLFQKPGSRPGLMPNRLAPTNGQAAASGFSDFPRATARPTTEYKVPPDPEAILKGTPACQPHQARLGPLTQSGPMCHTRHGAAGALSRRALQPPHVTEAVGRHDAKPSRATQGGEEGNDAQAPLLCIM